MPTPVTLIPGDGIGPEVTNAARRILDAAGSDLQWHVHDAGADVIRGGAGRDFLADGAGGDVVRGQDGNDTLELGQGNDDLSGGEGNDTVLGLHGFGVAVVIDLTAGEAQGSLVGLDTIALFERAVGTELDDTLIGDSADNVLIGAEGDDHIEGRDGDDELDGREGLDLLDGGPGTDECLNGETVLNCEA